MSIKTALCFILIFVLLLCVFSMTAFADASFSNQPYSVNEVVYITYTSPSNFKAIVISSSPSDYYTFLVGQYVYVVTTEPGQIVSNDSFHNGSQSLSQYPDSSLMNLYYTIHGYTSSGDVIESDIPTFSQLSEGMTALDSFINSIPETSSSLNYSLPPGNIAYIKLPSSIPDGVDYILNTTFPVLDLSSYSLNNQVASVISSIPSGVSTAPSSPTIPWSANGKVNLFGLSRHQSYSAHIPSQYGGYYLMVCNPLYYPVTSTGGQGITPPENGYIDISIDSAVDIAVYPLDSRLQFSGTGLVVDATTTGDFYTGEFDEESDSLIWQDPLGGDTPPQVGGNTQIDSINDNIFDYLRNFATSISEFIRGPVQAIKVVVGAISDFLTSFTQLYTWLPSPVYNLITSALMIAITIGVIKIFV